jgi:anaerobic magnesium-protoporphyrin IX monomethyl ester cyclase
MKIVFINPNYHNRSGRPPLGLLSIASVCKEAGHSVNILDANILNLDAANVAEWTYGYDLVGITSTTPSIGEAMSIARYIKASQPYKPIVLGGVHASVFPDECYDTGLFNAVIVGEGESAILEYLSYLASVPSPRKDNRVMVRNHIIDLNSIPIPDYSLLDIDSYRPQYPHGQHGKWISASTSRGCPYTCSFCVKAVSGNKFRCMNSDRVIALLSDLTQKYGVQDITFYDDLFTLDSKRVHDICSWIISNKVDLSWTCESRVTVNDTDLLNLMAMAGCRMIYYGIESGNQNILRNLSKGITISQICNAVKVTHEAGIKAAGYFMLGCPGETKETMQQTIQFAHDLGLDHAQFSVCSPLPGSKLYEQYVKAGYPVPDWSNFQYLGDVDKPMFTSKELSKEDIESAVKEANEAWQVKV